MDKEATEPPRHDPTPERIGLGLLIVGGLLGLTAVLSFFTIFWQPINAIDGLLLRGIPAAVLVFAGISLRKPRS